MSHCPEEVLDQILTRLPVKSLLKFRCVSKSRRSLIDSSHFVSLHLRRSIETKTDCFLILMADLLHLFDFDFHGGHFKPVTSNVNSQQLGCDKGFIRVWGSCNGLVCLSVRTRVVLWNPATRNIRRLPYEVFRPIHELSNWSERVTFGFGYDSINDDYKVVALFGGICPGTIGFKVYSLNSNSWHTGGDKVPQGPRSFVSGMTRPALVNGALHWVVLSEQPRLPRADSMIVALDLSSETFKTIPHPVDYWSSITCRMRVDSFGGCFTEIGSNVDIWVMKDYGVKESWSKLLSAAQVDEFTDTNYLRPMASSNCGSQVLLHEGKRNLLWYDVERKTVQYLKSLDVDGLVDIRMSVGSLVSVYGGGEDVEAEHLIEGERAGKRKLATYL